MLQIIVPLLSISAVACSGPKTVSRTGTSPQTSADSTSSTNFENTNRPSDDNINPPGYETGAVPVPISGTNLAEVKVFAKCAVASDCSKVRLGASIKVGTAEPVRFAKESLALLGIKSFVWTAPASCQVNGDEYQFNPLCSGTSSTDHLEANLAIVGADDKSFVGKTPDGPPVSDNSIIGNFMRVDGTAGFMVTGKTPDGQESTYNGVQLFTQIWVDLKRGLYFTNFLYNGNGNISWPGAKNMCENYINSGDGVRKWKLPSQVDFCGDLYAEGQCGGGLFWDGVGMLPMDGDSWTHNKWAEESSSDGGGAWTANMMNGSGTKSDKTNIGVGIICVRK